MIIAGFPGVGKTSLAKKYKNVIDLESSFYKYFIDDEIDNEILKGTDREPNPNYPKNYIEAIEHYKDIYDIVLTCNSPKIKNLLREKNIPFILCFPTFADKENYVKRYKNRGNNSRCVSFFEKNYNPFLNMVMSDSEEKWILTQNQTLEEMLISKRIKLIKKD